MALIDFLVLGGYLLGTLAVGLYYARRNRRSRDMFAAGGRSPWWVAGLSSFMTLKSAGTFVVWGGLAYREGVVAIAINTCIGVAGLLVGWRVAGRWRRTGVGTPAEFVALRFGPSAVQLYTWAMMAVRILSTGVALYALAVMLVALVPLAPGHPLRDAATGHLSLAFAIVLFGAIVVTYTVAGGLWAVLMTDVLQFIVLQLAVLFVIPLLWLEVHASAPAATLPDGFFLPFSDRYTLWFMAGWVAVHFFLVGAEWAFAQRYICVPSERDARRSAWLFGVLYLVSPAVWLTPPILFRMLQADADPEQAYILASQRVLPAGMLGVMMAAMFSATASAISGQINVFAGVLTEQFYRPWLGDAWSERRLVAAGRAFALAIGAALIGVALCVPRMGGAETIVLTVTGMLFGPLMAPTLWGLLSGRIGTVTVFVTALASFTAGMVVRIGLGPGGAWASSTAGRWIHANPRLTDVLVGAVLPVLILTVSQLCARRDQPQWRVIRARMDAYAPTPLGADDAGALAPARVVAIGLGATGLLSLGLLAVNQHGHLALLLFGVVLLVLARLAWRVPH
ncbi:sodium:solute symporter family transporter [Stenotrophomonas sp. LGBM10]|uniref:sodium:solute symporter family transporter n=1 Tax=Stenotrophomonas sp. LGBM10 TaxID=3390038 RepID=UPI00398B2E91